MNKVKAVVLAVFLLAGALLLRSLGPAEHPPTLEVDVE